MLKIYFKKLFHILQIFLIFAVITGWLFSGWPQILNFPPKVPEAQAAIAKVGTDATGTGNATPLEFSHTLVSGSNRIIICAAGIENSGDTSISATYGGQTMTEAVQEETGTSGYLYDAAIFYLLEENLPSDGANTVSFAFSGTLSSVEVNAWCGEYTGVSQGSPEATDPTIWTSGTTITNDISPSTGAWVISAAGMGNAGTWTHGQSQVETYDANDSSSAFATAELQGASGETSLDSTASGTINRGVRIAASWTPAPVNPVTIADSTLDQPEYVLEGATSIVMGAFTFVASTSDATVTAITISEAGTVNASSSLSNVKLYAQEEGTCSFEGSSQIGTTQSFNASEDATFSSLSLLVGTITQQCVFVVLDVDSDAGGGNTIEIEITASGDVSITDASVTGSFPVQFSGTTTIRASSGTIMSTEIDFDWVPGRSQWGEVYWSTTEPSGSDSTTSVWYTVSSACDTIIPNSALSGNEAGFDVSASPKDISGLSTSTYNRICLRASLAVGTATSSPALDYWKVTWEPPTAEGITISGTVYDDDLGSSPVGDGTKVSVAINTTKDTNYATTTSGSFSFTTVNGINSGDTLTLFLDTDGGIVGSLVTISDGNDLTGIEFYQNHLVVRYETGSDISIVDMTKYDNNNDSDVNFTAEDASPDTLIVEDGSEFFIPSGFNFDADGNLESGTDGIDDIEIKGTYTAGAGETIRVSGSWKNSGTFEESTSTVIFDGTTSEQITSGGVAGDFYNLVFNGSGQWTLQDAMIVNGDTTTTAGTLTGAYNLTVNGGKITGTNGSINFTDATTTLSGIGNLGPTGSGTYSFYNLSLSGTTTLAGPITTKSDLTINSGNSLDVSGSDYNISCGGSWLNSGTFTAQNGTVTFDATTTGKTITAGGSDFYQLEFNGSGGQWTLQDAATATATTTLTLGTLVQAANYNLTLASFTLESGTTFTKASGSGLLIFESAGNIYIEDNTSPKQNLGNVHIGTSPATTYQNSDIKVDSLTVNDADTHNSRGYEIDCSGNITVYGTLDATDGGEGDGTVITLGGNWQVSTSTSGIFTKADSEVIFNATSTGKTISDGGWPFYLITFNGSGGGWLYQDSTSTAPATTTVHDGTATFLNAKTGGVLVDGGTLNVDWYLGIHVVAKDSTSTNIDTGDTDITISENSTTSQTTVWKISGGSWGTASTTQTTGSGSNGKNPQPNSDGAIRIREYQKTSGATTFYKYNLEISSQSGFNPYDYHSDYGDNYITSASSTEGSGVDKCISQNWHRVDIANLNTPYSTLNEPPTNGSWYVGMLSDLEFSVDSASVNLGNLNGGNNFTATGTTLLSATTSYPSGYTIKAYASYDGRLKLGATENYIERWPYANSTPAVWSGNCISDSQCGFGYTTSDNNLGGGTADRFATSTKFAGFATSTPGDQVADETTAVPSGSQYTITYKVSVLTTQAPGDYNTTVYYICTANY
jgi:hypothetical protein